MATSLLGRFYKQKPIGFQFGHQKKRNAGMSGEGWQDAAGIAIWPA
jgi:hypothetical protein